MTEVAKTLSVTGNHWAVAISKSHLSNAECNAIANCWKLVSFTPATKTNDQFARYIQHIGRVLHNDDSHRDYHGYLAEATSNSSQSYTKLHLYLSTDKVIESMFWLDSNIEQQFHGASEAARRLEDLSNCIAKIEHNLRLYKKYSLKSMHHESDFDVSTCQKQRDMMNVETAVLKNHIQTIISPVRIF